MCKSNKCKSKVCGLRNIFFSVIGGFALFVDMGKRKECQFGHILFKETSLLYNFYCIFFQKG